MSQNTAEQQQRVNERAGAIAKRDAWYAEHRMARK